MTSQVSCGILEDMTSQVSGTTILLKLNMVESHFFTMCLGRILPSTEFSGLMPVNYFEVICWLSRRM